MSFEPFWWSITREDWFKWTLPINRQCINPTEAVASYSERTNGGYVSVFVMKIGREYMWMESAGFRVEPIDVYIITYRNPRSPLFRLPTHPLFCDKIYGFGPNLNGALEMAKRKWASEVEAALKALGIDGVRFYNEFCRTCDVERQVECVYCENPFKVIEEKKDEIYRQLQEMSNKYKPWEYEVIGP